MFTRLWQMKHNSLLAKPVRKEVTRLRQVAAMRHECRRVRESHETHRHHDEVVCHDTPAHGVEDATALAKVRVHIGHLAAHTDDCLPLCPQFGQHSRANCLCKTQKRRQGDCERHEGTCKQRVCNTGTIDRFRDAVVQQIQRRLKRQSRRDGQIIDRPDSSPIRCELRMRCDVRSRRASLSNSRER